MVVDEKLEDLNKNIEDAQCLVVTLRTSITKAKELFEDKDYIRELEIEDSQDSGCVDVRIYFNDPADKREEIFNLIVQNKLTLLQMYVEKKSLEDIFLEVTTPKIENENEVTVSDDTQGKVCMTDDVEEDDEQNEDAEEESVKNIDDKDGASTNKLSQENNDEDKEEK